MKKGYRLSSYTREMLKRYGSWEAGRYHYEVNAYPKIFGDPKILRLPTKFATPCSETAKLLTGTSNFNPPEDGRRHRPKRPAGRRGSHPQIHDILEVLAMENKNMTAAREWENDPNCFLRMLNSPAQQRSRIARRQKDADRERFNNVLNAVAIGAAAFAVTLLVICFVL